MTKPRDPETEAIIEQWGWAMTPSDEQATAKGIEAWWAWAKGQASDHG